MAARKQQGFTVPGFDLALNWPEMKVMPNRRMLPEDNTLLLSALDGSESPNDCYTVRERTIIALMNELTDLPEWSRKIYDPDFTFKWKSAKLLSGKDITKAMVEWCVEEVKYYVSDFIQSKYVPAIDGGVIKSDNVIPEILHREIQNEVAKLRKPTQQKSYTSETSDIVDPFLYAFDWTHTKTLHFENPLTLSDCIERIGEGKLAHQPPENECPIEERSRYPNSTAFSRRFQFLPFDISFGPRGDSGPTITSYINNIHPVHHLPFYHTIETLISLTLPLFNRTLTATKAPSYENSRLHVAVLGRDPMIQTDLPPFSPPEQRSTSDFVSPDTNTYHPWLSTDLRKEFWNIGLQYVLHVQEIKLTPSSPKYSGEDWHVAGSRNERICATTHYTLSTCNITTPRLSFRRRVHTEEAMLAAGYITHPPYAPAIYGAAEGDPVIQHMGDITLRENRTVTYPNIWQTRLLPFELKDKSKPGGVTVLTLHLIDPNRRMMSTALVPPQQGGWWAEEVRKGCERLRGLPAEVWEGIVRLVEQGEGGEGGRIEFRRERAEWQGRHTRAMEEYLQWDFGEEEEGV